MADSHQPLGQNMQQEAADELGCPQGHDLVLVVIPVVFVTKADFAVVIFDQAGVTDGGSMAEQLLLHFLMSLQIIRQSVLTSIPLMPFQLLTYVEQLILLMPQILSLALVSEITPLFALSLLLTIVEMSR